MRLLALLAALAALLLACVAPDVAHYGTKTIATRNCRDPQTAYAGEVTNLNALGKAEWRKQADLSQPVDVEVSCDDFTSDCADFHVQAACGTQAGYYVLGDDTVHVDHGRANDVFAFSAVMNHELLHWYIFHGPHPERAQLHVCPCGMEHMTGCWPNDCALSGTQHLMLAKLDGLGVPMTTQWNGDTETLDVGDVAQNVPTDVDRRFVDWALTP